MSARIPSTYAGADKLSADARGALACGRLVWESLATRRSIESGTRSLKQQTLVAGWNERGAPTRGKRPGLAMRTELVRLGIVSPIGDEWAPLTPVWILAREAGIRTTVEVADVA